MTIIYLKDPSAEEALNMSEQGMSPESLEKTKDGSTFAAKARAAELQAGRAQQAVAADFDDDLTTLTPVTPESFTITRSCSRASHGGKPPNALTEQPKVTANETPILPTPSLPVLPIHSVPRHIVSIENFQSTAHPVSHQAAVFSETEGDDRSVTSEETVIPW